MDFPFKITKKKTKKLSGKALLFNAITRHRGSHTCTHMTRTSITGERVLLEIDSRAKIDRMGVFHSSLVCQLIFIHEIRASKFINKQFLGVDVWLSNNVSFALVCRVICGKTAPANHYRIFYIYPKWPTCCLCVWQCKWTTFIHIHMLFPHADLVAQIVRNEAHMLNAIKLAWLCANFSFRNVWSSFLWLTCANELFKNWHVFYSFFPLTVILLFLHFTC